MTEPIPDLARDLGQSPYELDRPVAQGGMGEVWEVSHRALGTRYVMKVLRADLGRRRDLEKRLKIEARASVQLEQENVVRVHDFGWTESGRPYLVMEKLEGETLHKEYEGKVLPPAEVVAIAKDTLAGLAAAHAAGFVHRDIKPDNLFYCAPDASGRRRVKVLDFGIAKILSTITEHGGSTRLVTEAGVMIGSPSYIAPEQARAQPIDGRTDLYSLGATMFRLLVGRPPFVGKTQIDILRQHVSIAVEPPQSVATQSIPEALGDIVVRAMAKDPADRFATAEDMLAELTALEHRLGWIAEISATRRALADGTLATPSPAAPAAEPTTYGRAFDASSEASDGPSPRVAPAVELAPSCVETARESSLAPRKPGQRPIPPWIVFGLGVIVGALILAALAALMPGCGPGAAGLAGSR